MQTRTALILSWSLLCWLVLAPLPAAAADSLFSAEQPVADDGSETRNRVLSDMLREVLVKVSGNSSVAGQPAAREIAADAPSLVQQYRYRTAERDGELVQFLFAQFDQAAVERLMRERNLPVWTQRPQVLMWLAVEQAGQRQLLNLDDRPQARAALMDRARARGLPLQLPLMDLEDRNSLAPADVWADYAEGIRSASFRYPHDAVLTGRLREQPGGRWTGVWSLQDEGGTQRFQTPALPLDEALAFAVDQTQNQLAARYAPMPGAGVGSGTLVGFSGVHDLAAYGRLVALLDTLEPVSRVALREVADDSFVFGFELRGSTQDLRRALDGSGLLQTEPAPGAQPGGSGAAVQPEFNYRLIN